MLARPVGVEVGAVHQVIARDDAADREGYVPGPAAIGGAVADQKLDVIRVLCQDIRDLVGVGGLRPALVAKLTAATSMPNSAAAAAHQIAALIPLPSQADMALVDSPVEFAWTAMGRRTNPRSGS